MRLAVVGATGRLGAAVVTAAREAGHDVSPLTRGGGQDVVTGVGLEAALDGADALVDCFDPGLRRRGPASSAFAVATRTLQAAALRAGVRRHVVISIVGVDRPELAGMGYYRAKLAQEDAVRSGVLPFAVLRSTQWFEFADQVLAMAWIGPVSLVPRMLAQPVAAGSVARRLVDLATADGDPPALSEIAGPEPMTVLELAHRVLAHRGASRRLVSVPLPGAARAAAGGALLPGPDAVIDLVTLQEWLVG